MNHSQIQEQWYDEFIELLWEHHTCDWEYANSNPNYPFQLAYAYFDWEWDSFGDAVAPIEHPEEAFERYLESE